MAADVQVKKKPLLLNPCCIQWKEKCLRIDKARNHLREALEIVTSAVDKLQAENNTFKEAFEAEKARVAAEKEEDLALRVGLENEISALKSEISSLKEKGTADPDDKKGEDKVSEEDVSKLETEIARLKALLEKEKMRADSEKKNAEAQKKSASEAWKLMNAEKLKANEERKIAFGEGKKAEEYCLQLEGLRKELEEVKSKLVLVTEKFEEGRKMLDAETDKMTKEEKYSDLEMVKAEQQCETKKENEKFMEEKSRADSEMARAEEQRKLAEANWKNFMEEKSRTHNLSLQLNDARQTIERLQKEINKSMSFKNVDSGYQCDQCKIAALNSEMSSLQQNGSLDVDDKTSEVKQFQDCISEWEKQISHLKVLIEKEKEKADYMKKNAEKEKKSAAEAWKCVKAEKAKANDKKRSADIERERAEGYRIQLEASKKEANETNTRQASQVLQLERAIEDLKKEKLQLQTELTDIKQTSVGLKEAEEQRRLMEVNKKMALREKSRADQLSFQLEECKCKIEVQQKQIQELLSRRAVEVCPTLHDNGDNAEARNLRLVGKQLKLEKMRLKYAKQLGKLEKNRNRRLHEELARIKMDSIQISQRLGALDGWFFSGIECKEDMDKVENMQSPKLRRKFCDCEPFPNHARTESRLHKSSCMTVAASDPLSKTLLCTGPSFPVFRGNCSASISGIDSKLESLAGGSSQKLLESSAMNSSSASFSDGQLAGSQDRGAIVSTTPEKQAEGNDGQTISCMSGEVAKIHCNENPAVVGENSVRSPDRLAFGKLDVHGRKSNRVLDTIESVEILCSEGKKLNFLMEEKLSVLHGLLKIDGPVKEAKCGEALGPSDLYTKHEGVQKKRKVAGDDGTISQHLGSTDELGRITDIRNHVHGDANACGLSSSCAIELLGIPQESTKGLRDSCGSEIIAMEKVEDFESIMKLMELDNAAEEECFSIGMEIPLSPTLPEIEISTLEVSDMDELKVVSVGGLLNEKELKHENEGLVDCFGMFGNENSYYIMDPGGTPDRQTGHKVVKNLNALNSGDNGLKSSKISSQRKLGLGHENIPAYCVIFSSINDSESVSRIFCSTIACAIRCSFEVEEACVVQNIVHALKTEKILPREKACVLFTMLLLSFSSCTSLKSGRFAEKDFVLCVNSVAYQLSAVVSDVEARRRVSELSCWDELLSLAEDFLINGQLIVRADASFDICDTRMSIDLDGVSVNLSLKPASAEQLVVGGIILASLCAATNLIERICEVSYYLLRRRKYNTDVLLTILHVFAYLGGERFFSSKEYNLIMTVVKSLIVFLEGGHPSATSDSCLSPSHVVRSRFHSGAKCPFDADSTDMVRSSLLEKLHSYAHSATMHHYPMESTNVSNSYIHKDNAIRNAGHELVDVNSSCVATSTHANSVGSGISLDLSDVLSSVELMAGYMSWEWTSAKVIPVLLEILERCILDDFAVAVIILLGQLGRLGVASHGCEDKEVENLKSKLFGFLGRDTPGESLSIQSAIITSLLGILSLDFEAVLQGDLKPTASQSAYTDQIRKWYYSLSKEQQTFAYSLLQSAVVAV